MDMALMDMALLNRVRFESPLIIITIYFLARITITHIVLIFIRATINICRVRILHHRNGLRLEEEQNKRSTHNTDKKGYDTKMFKHLFITYI
jgi:hypothetical protein